MKRLIAFLLLLQFNSFAQTQPSVEGQRLEIIAQNIKLLLELDRLSSVGEGLATDVLGVRDRDMAKDGSDLISSGAITIVAAFWVASSMTQDAADNGAGIFAISAGAPMILASAAGVGSSAVGSSMQFQSSTSIGTSANGLVHKVVSGEDKQKVADAENKIKIEVPKIASFLKDSFDLTAEETEKLKNIILNEYNRAFVHNNERNGEYTASICPKNIHELMIENNIASAKVGRYLEIKKELEEIQAEVSKMSEVDKMAFSREVQLDVQDVLLKLLKGHYEQTGNEEGFIYITKLFKKHQLLKELQQKN